MVRSETLVRSWASLCNMASPLRISKLDLGVWVFMLGKFRSEEICSCLDDLELHGVIPTRFRTRSRLEDVGVLAEWMILVCAQRRCSLLNVLLVDGLILTTNNRCSMLIGSFATARCCLLKPIDAGLPKFIAADLLKSIATVLLSGSSCFVVNPVCCHFELVRSCWFVDLTSLAFFRCCLSFIFCGCFEGLHATCRCYRVPCYCISWQYLL